MVRRSSQTSRFHVLEELDKGRKCSQTMKPQPAGRSRPQLLRRAQTRSAGRPIRSERGQPPPPPPSILGASRRGAGPARGAWAAEGSAFAPSPLLPGGLVSFRQVLQARSSTGGGRDLCAPAAYRPLFKKNRSCNHSGTNQSVLSFRV